MRSCLLSLIPDFTQAWCTEYCGLHHGVSLSASSRLKLVLYIWTPDFTPSARDRPRSALNRARSTFVALYGHVFTKAKVRKNVELLITRQSHVDSTCGRFLVHLCRYTCFRNKVGEQSQYSKDPERRFLENKEIGTPKRRQRKI